VFYVCLAAFSLSCFSVFHQTLEDPEAVGASPKYTDIMKTPGMTVRPHPEYQEKKGLVMELQIENSDDVQRNVDEVTTLFESMFEAFEGWRMSQWFKFDVSLQAVYRWSVQVAAKKTNLASTPLLLAFS
jgi:hypothetical protein